MEEVVVVTVVGLCDGWVVGRWEGVLVGICEEWVTGMCEAVLVGAVVRA